jgi:hypothetical protein
VKALDVSEIKDKPYAELIVSNAIQSLIKMGPEAKLAIPRIEQIEKDPQTGDYARTVAHRALEALRN